MHADAAGKLRTAQRHQIALYLIGYYVECTAKAACVATHRRPSVAGAAGHHLPSLLEDGGLRLADLQPEWRDFAQRKICHLT